MDGQIATTLIDATTNALGDVLGWIGTVIGGLVNKNGNLHALLPLFAITVAVSAIMLGIKVIKGFVWGA